MPRALAFALAIAALLSSCGSEGRPPQAPADTTLRVATWNLKWLGAVPGQGEQPRSNADYARLRRYAERLDADVVALQEVEGERAIRRVFDPAAYAFHFTREADQLQRTGFAWRRSLRVEVLPDLVALRIENTRRGADVRVHFGGRTLRLLSVHLKAHCADGLPESTEACDILFDQLPPLESWIDARAGEGEPFAVLGDFNRHLGPRDPFWLDLDDGEPGGADLVDVLRGGKPRCWSGRYGRFIDHLVLGQVAAGWIVPDSGQELVYDGSDGRFEEVLSDHCPLLVELDLERQAGAASASPPRLEPDEAARHVGQTATVCGTVASTHFAEDSKGRPTFLNLGRPYPDQSFTVVIFGDDRAAFGEPERRYRGQRICVSGTIELYKGKPQIVAHTPHQIR
jgi:endonuclease/exonuclease/phosphatase family metal-dependent hydrolase